MRSIAGPGPKTRLYGVIGHPLGHTLSPALHNAAFAASHVDAVYVALPVEPAHLPGAIAGCRAWRLGGLNVTVPHKVAVMDHLDGLTDEARAAGAVNTIFWRQDELWGDNTDIAGYLSMLDTGTGHGHELGIGPDTAPGHRPDTALILGAGGAARAVALALARCKIRAQVAARRPEQAEALAADVGAEAISWESLSGHLAAAQLLINCTPVGMQPDSRSCPLSDAQIAALPPDAAVHDLVYRPLETALLARARARGLRTVDGGTMLVAQAAAAFSRWTGQDPPLAVMRAAFDQASEAGEVRI
ncbi:MAG: shikimate dehydrogenase [Candidatus Sericytochromatia bacterium]|uniref:Shikimate dehydrogenase (NADP(+)) n=1 Tax=Candidatus Tanganyikabacteria bacterium TaxID=2961651 RepID=A0A937X0I9_9BACT|nr:shikimate dehydrogenase [Candidatus Tanganyikabacteria bacterium]